MVARGGSRGGQPADKGVQTVGQRTVGQRASPKCQPLGFHRLAKLGIIHQTVPFGGNEPWRDLRLQYAVGGPGPGVGAIGVVGIAVAKGKTAVGQVVETVAVDEMGQLRSQEEPGLMAGGGKSGRGRKQQIDTII